MTVAVAILLGAVSSGLLTALVAPMAAKRKTRADTTKVLIDAATELLEPYKGLPAEVAKLRGENRQLRQSVDELTEQLRIARFELHAERERMTVREREFAVSVADLVARIAGAPIHGNGLA